MFEKRMCAGRLHLISFILIITLVMTSVGIGFGAETSNKAILVVSSAEVDLGQTAKITVSVKNNPGMTTVDFRMSYDSTAMELVSCTNGSLLQGFMKGQSMADNPFFCGWMNSLQKTDCKKDGTLVTLEFKVKESARAGSYTIGLNSGVVTAYNTNLDEVTFDVSSGTIKVKGEDPEQKPEDGNDKPSAPSTPSTPGTSGGVSGGGSVSSGSSVSGGGISGGTSSGSTTDDKTSADTEKDSQTEADKAAAEKQAKLIKKFESMSVKITSAKYSTAKKRVTLKYKKTNSGIKCPQYQIYRSTKKNSGYKKIYTTTKTTFTNKSLGKNVKAYYYKVRGVRKFDGKNYYTQWSKKVKVTIKK